LEQARDRICLIVAGGSGSRIGGEIPKQLLLLSGKPLIAYTINAILSAMPGLPIVISSHPELIRNWKDVEKHLIRDAGPHRIELTPGGSTRCASVQNGLEAIQESRNSLGLTTDDPLVAIHDGVRPFLSSLILLSAFATAGKSGNAVVCVPVKASLRKRIATGTIALDRSEYLEVQTPQIFRLKPILDCYRKRTHDDFTDDASLAEFFGHQIATCKGSHENIKLTTVEDFAIAKRLLKK